MEPAGHVVLPPLVHLTWKSKTDLPPYGEANVAKWRQLNPGHTVRLYDDADIEAFVRRHCAELAPFWSLLKPVQRADVFRYAVMWKEGGVYADLDVEPLRPIDEWVMSGTRDTLHWRSVKVLIGWEEITERPDWKGYFASPMQLCQWTLASAPGHALWQHVLTEILLFYQAGKYVALKSVIRSTGPGMFSAAVKSFLKREHGAAIGEPPLTLQALKRANLHVADVLVLKKTAFAGVPGDAEDTSLVRHMFAGSWKTPAPAAAVMIRAKEETSSAEEQAAAQMALWRERHRSARVPQAGSAGSEREAVIEKVEGELEKAQEQRRRRRQQQQRERTSHESKRLSPEQRATWSEVHASQAKHEEYAEPKGALSAEKPVAERPTSVWKPLKKAPFNHGMD